MVALLPRRPVSYKQKVSPVSEPSLRVLELSVMESHPGVLRVPIFSRISCAQLVHGWCTGNPRPVHELCEKSGKKN